VRYLFQYSHNKREVRKVKMEPNGKLKEAITLKLLRPPAGKRKKSEMPKEFPGKPLSEYLKEVRT
jgi:hypothetical protein